MKLTRLLLTYTMIIMISSLNHILGKRIQNDQKVLPKGSYRHNFPRKLEEGNSIIIRFNREVSYPYGFGKIAFDQSPNGYRTQNYYINIGLDDTFGPDESFTVSQGSYLEIYFQDGSLTNLTRFFHNYYDPNVEYIESVDLSNLESWDLKSVEGMFYGCTSLKSIDLSNFYAPSLENMNKMFFHCSFLKSIDLSDLYSNSILDTGCLFCGCSSLEYLDISGLNLTNAKDTSNMFFNIGNLKYINLYNIEAPETFFEEIIGEFGINGKDDSTVCQSRKIITNPTDRYICCNFNLYINNCDDNANYIEVYYKEDVQYDNGFLYDNEGLENEGRKIIFHINYQDTMFNVTDKIQIQKNIPVKIIFPSPVETLESFFDADYDANAAKIISIDLSNFDSSLVMSVRRMFNQCSSLESIIGLSNFKTSSVDDMSYMFSGCASLQAIDVTNFDTKYVYDLSYMFEGCASLQAIDVTNFDTSSVDYLSNMFEGCKKLESIDISKFDISYIYDMSYFFSDCSSLKSIDLSNFEFYFLEDLSYLFNGCNQLESININFVAEYLVDISGMFKGCSQLKSVNVSIEHYEYIIYMDYMFSGCSSLEYIDLGFFSPYKMSYTFSECTSLEFIYLHDFSSSQIYDMSYMFSGCTSLESIDLSDFNSDEVENLSGMFKGCSKLKSIGLSDFYTSKVTDMSYMFSGCSSLESINLSDFYTSQVTDMSYMFSGCSLLQILTLPNFDTSLVTNMASMFNGCEKLFYLDISHFDMNNLQDASKMFSGIEDYIYIDLSNVQNYENEKFQQELNMNNGLNSKNGIIICQKNNIVNNEKANYLCCDFDFDTRSCKSTNYITVYYKMKTTYKYGYRFNDQNEEIEFRKNINFIKYGDWIFSDKYKLIIEANSKFEIHFSTTLTSLQSFFDANFDEKAVNIKAIDFKNFDKSLITNMNSIFNGCSGLMFLDMSVFDMKNVDDIENMFKGVSNLKYIDITKIQNYENFQSEISLISELSSNKNLFVCQDDEIISKENIKLLCCDWNVTSGICQSTNYITIKYNNEFYESIEYKYGFQIQNYRVNMSFINYDGSTFTGKDQLIIAPRPNTEIEIHFTNVTSLQHFFNYQIDVKVVYILSIDFSHLDSSLITCLESTFAGCSGLKFINFTNFKTSSVTSMKEMFKSCSNLISLDLSGFDTSSVTDMSYMFNSCSSLISLNLSNFDTSSLSSLSYIFSGCQNLIYLNISNFNLTKFSSGDYMFQNLDNLRYINLYGISNYDEQFKSIINQNTALNDNDSLIVCQKDEIVNKANKVNAQYICCDYIITNQTCNISNYIEIIYKESVSYNYGFQYKGENSKNEARNNISFISIDNKIYDGKSYLDINADEKIKINFGSSSINFEKFFDSDEDSVSAKIKIIDFSHLSSSIVTTANMFKGCSSLESINLNKIKISLVTNMNNMFSGCSSLEVINASNIYTDGVTSMKSMFNGCTNLISLYIPNFSINGNCSCDDMFSGLSNLQYIDIYDIFPSESFKSAISVLKFNTNLYACIKSNDYKIIENANYVCGGTSDDSDGGDNTGGTDDQPSEVNTHWIKIQFSQLISINDCFKNNNQNQVIKERSSIYSVIIKREDGTKVTCGNGKINIAAEDYVEIHFSTSITSLESFFDYNKDNNDRTKSLSSVDFENFDSSQEGTNIKRLFYGCSGLKSVNFHNLKPNNDVSFMFYGCELLNSIDLTNFRQNTYNMESMFQNCVELKSVSLDNIQVSSMKNMFNGCTNLKIVILTNLGTPSGSQVEMENIFSGCNSLKMVDISNGDFLNCKETTIFEGITSIKYLNMFEITEYDNINFDTLEENYEELIVCQDTEILTKEAFNYICCDFNIDIEMCLQSDNYIIVEYGNESDISYEGGFQKEYNDINEYRNNINFINFEKTIDGKKNFIIKAGDSIEIHFSSPVRSLAHFFDSTYDPQVEKIISIDFTNFDSSSLTDINSLFKGCSKLTNIVFGNFKTSFVTDMNNMFSGCNELYSINLETFETSNVKNMAEMFNDCSSLKEIDLTNFDTSSVTDMSKMFKGCNALEEIDLHNFKTELVTNMNDMFSDCLALVNIDLCNFKTSSVTDMSNMFYNCRNLKYLDLYGFDMSKVTKTENMFYNLQSLRYINLYKVKNSYKNITNQLNVIEGMLVCQNENIVTSNAIVNICCYFNLLSEECIQSNYMILHFENDVEYNSGFINNIDNRENIAFIVNGHHDLTTYNNIKLIIRAGQKVEIHFESNINNLESFFNAFVDPNMAHIKSIDLYHFDSSKVTNMDFMFMGCSSLESIDFTNIETSLVTSMSNMFYNCGSLESIDLSFLDTDLVQNMSSIFYGCNKLTELNLINFKTPFITDMNHMFYGCSSLRSLDISSFITSSVVDMNSMFYGCSSLESIDLTHFNTSSVTDMNSMFYECSSLASIDLTHFDTSSVTDIDSMFYGCSKLEIIDLWNFNTSKVYDMHNLFYGCTSLKFLDLYNFNMEKTISAHDMFKEVEKLEYINLFNVENNYNNITETNLNRKNGLYVCQKDDIITNKEAINKCCYYNTKSTAEDKCESTNYIIIFFGQNATYKSGFITSTEEGEVNKYRSDIKFVVNNEHSYKLETTSELNIRERGKLEIHYTSNITSLESFFNINYDQNVEKIEKISLAHLFSSSVTQMSNLFFGCSSLETVDFYNFDSKLVKKMNNLFSLCQSLISVNLTSFDTPSLVTMENMFSGCNSLKSIDLMNFNTSLVEKMNSLFSDCKSLEVIDLWNFDTSMVTDMSSMFLRCYSLQVLDISSFNMININSVNNMFRDVVALKYINLFNALNTGKNITNSDLQKIANLTVCQKELIVKNNDRIDACCYLNKTAMSCEFDNYMIIYYGADSKYNHGFENKENGNINDYRKDKNIDFITYIDHDSVLLPSDELIISKDHKIEIYFSEPVTSLKSFFDSQHDPNTENIVSIDLSHFDASELTDMSSMFKGCKSLKSIYFPLKGITKLNNMNSLFYGCGSLESIDLSLFNTSLVTDMNSLFYNCSLLKSPDLTTFNTTLVTNMGSMFYGCGSLESIDLTYFNTSLVTDMNSMFYGCSKIEIFDLWNFDTSKVTNMSSMFYGCSSLELIDLAYFDTSLVTNMGSMFNGCGSLKYLDISNFNMIKVINVGSMFEKVDKLKYINLYYVQKSYENITRSYLRNIQKLTVCQKEKLVTNEDATNECCYYNILSEQCESKNFIVVYFGENVEYNSGFENEIRNGNNIEYIVGLDHNKKFSGKDKLDIKAGKKIEIYFSSPITSLENYFSSSYDDNMKNTISMDLSNFDTSLITNMKSTFYGCNLLKSIDLENLDTASVESMNSMFYGCNSLQSLDLSDFDTSSVTDMGNMFYDCNKIELLDLSYFNTSLVTDMSNMFNKCKSLKLLDLSHFNMGKVTSIDSMFNELEGLKYINLYHMKNYHKDIETSYLKSISKLTVCQSEKIIMNEDAIEKCCYYNMIKNDCENTNYIIMYYKEDAEYNNGFTKNEKDSSQFRNDIDFIIHRDHYSKLTGKDKLVVKKGKKLELYYSTPIKSLQNYFSSLYDSNMKKVISIDFSYFNSSLIENTNSMFYECSSLQTIEFSNFYTPLTNNMNSMFYGCNSLQSLDLSYFNTSLVTDMSNMFDKCNSLNLLDISRFNMEKTTNIDSMFNEVDLKYINLYYVQNWRRTDIAQSYLKDIKNLIVCQREKIIKNEDLINKCCYYNVESNECENTNYIKIFYGKNVENAYYFAKDGSVKGKEIDYIINGNDHNLKLDATDKLYLHRGSKIEIYYKSSMSSLENYFSSTGDNNMANIASIYLSHFDFSLVTKMNSMFYECDSLELVDFTNVDTSSLKNMNSMFYGCNSLKYAELTYLNTSSVTDMSKMFYDCDKIELLDLSYFKTSKVTDMSNMFENCNSLIYLDISHFNMEKVTKINSMFVKVVNLKYINLYNTENSYKNITNSEIKELTDLIVCQKEEIITNYKESKCCYFNMETKTCESTNFVRIFYEKESDYIDGFKSQYRNEEDIEFIVSRNHYKKYSASDELYLSPGTKIEIYYKNNLKSLENYFNSVYDINMGNIYSVDLSKLDSSLLTDMKSLFQGCNLLETVDFTNFNSKLVTNMNSMFFGCSSLQSIDLSYLDVTSVLYMNYMFSGCRSIESIDLSYFETPSLINLEEMFYDCKSVKSIDLSNFKTSLVTNMDNMFSGCSSLKYLDISHFSMEKISKVDSMFENLINLKYINLYKAQDANDLIANSELNNIDKLTVCQSDNILKREDVINKCCSYNIETDECEYTNYIVAYYGSDVEYSGGFKNKYRNNIDYIIYDNVKISDTESFEIKKNSKIEIHFKSPLKTLESFFDMDVDKLVKDITSIDLSYFDSSEINNLNAMFYGCSSLESIDLSYFNASLVTTMEYLFGNCSSLKSLDLSDFDTSLVTSFRAIFSNCHSLESLSLSSINTSSATSIDSMFQNCNSLVSLDLSNFNTSQVNSMDYMFSGCTSLKVLDISTFILKSRDIDYTFQNLLNLKYINIYSIEDEKYKISNTELNDLANLTVCQSQNFLARKDVINKCCFYDIEKDICEMFNIITVYYGKIESEFANGFGYDGFGAVNDIRIKTIDYITMDNENTKILINETLTIKPYSKIVIYFKPNITSLENFFDWVNDVNAENIASIDLSHLDTSLITNFDSLFSGCSSLQSVDFSNINTSLITNMDSMFSGCSSIKSIDLTNFNTSSLTKMNSMFSACTTLESIYLSNFNTSLITQMKSLFYGCASLESIDLSYFNTSLVTDMSNMFCGCTELKVLDLLNFDMSNVGNYKLMFDDVNKLEYINLYKVQDSDRLLSKNPIQNLENLVVCQKEDILQDKENVCCYYDIKNSDCTSTNYIIVHYGENVEYSNGFENAFRKGISFIINVDYESPISSSNEFNVNYGCKIKIYFDSPITDLESFFDNNYDANVQKIVSIDLSHFDTSKVTNINKMFSGCSSLKSIDLTDKSISSINSMNYMFFGCKELESIDLSAFDTSLVTDMSYMFSGCSSLESMNFSYLNTSLVNNMNYMFYKCNSLASVDLSTYETSFLANLERMFYKCQNLNSINLSKFDTSSVINMNEMFYESNLLNYLDLSKFNMKSCNSYSNMFSNISNIKFINLQYADNDKTISKSFNQTNYFFVCQIKKIIQNPKAYNCCNYIFAPDECVIKIDSTNLEESELITQKEEVPKETTILPENTIRTTTFLTEKAEETSHVEEKTQNINPVTTSTIEIVKIPTTSITETQKLTAQTTSIEKESNNLIPSSSPINVDSTISIKTHTIEKESIEVIASTNKITENIQKETSETKETLVTDTIKSIEIKSEAIETTILKIKNTTTIEIPSTSLINSKEIIIPKTQTPTVLEDATAVLLGFSQFKMQSLSFSFHIHFVGVKGFIFSPILIFYVEIISKRILRLLDTHEAYCIKNDNNKEDDIKYASYTCNVQTQLSNIDQVKVASDFNFTTQNVKVVGISPIANAFINNIQNVGEEENDFSKTAIYILDHSIVNKYDNFIFNISGVIEEKKPNFTFIDFVLSIKILEDDEYIMGEVNCKIIDIIDKNYTLNCKGQENTKYNLQSAISQIENDLLLVNFDNNTDSEIIFTSSSPNSIIIDNKKEGGISTGAIVGIVIGILAIIASIVIIVIYIKRKKQDKNNFEESTIKTINL